MTMDYKIFLGYELWSVANYDTVILCLWLLSNLSLGSFICILVLYLVVLGCCTTFMPQSVVLAGSNMSTFSVKLWA